MMLTIAREARHRLSEFVPRDLTDVVWAIAQTGEKAPKLVKALGEAAKSRLKEFNSQELLRFLGAFRRAGGEAAVQAELASVQHELLYKFPALDGLQVTLIAQTPGGRHKRRHKNHSGDNLACEGDPQRADGGTTGVAIWEASFVLAEWLSRQANGFTRSPELADALPSGFKWSRWTGKLGVELGAGLGLPSIVAACLGAQMVATDGDAAVLRLLRQNVERNIAAKRRLQLRAEALLWGADDPLRRLGLKHAPDLLLAADVVYASAGEELTQKLIGTMLALSDAHTLVIMSNVRRFPQGHPREEGHFFASLERFFFRTVLPHWCLHPDFRRVGVGGCVIHALHRRPDLFPRELSVAEVTLDLPVSSRKRRQLETSDRSSKAARSVREERVQTSLTATGLPKVKKRRKLEAVARTRASAVLDHVQIPKRRGLRTTCQADNNDSLEL